MLKSTLSTPPTVQSEVSLEKKPDTEETTVNEQNDAGKSDISPRGFAAMDKEKRSQVARRGGSSVRRNRIDWKEKDALL